ncbi:MAG: extracellular solute-binding protein [Acidobacteria bacterium]|nr:extracellular solute-binding protein [Acidobacteriota bacterium]
MRKILYICLMSGWLAALGCGYLSETGGGDTATSLEPRGPVSMDKNDYPVFPDADAGADPAVSAEQGGKGFTGEGWETNTEFDFIGDPRAVKGGLLRETISDFPGNLRIEGPESNTFLNSIVEGMVYETLLGLHPTTMEYIPLLATHWQISPDKTTYRFRINPNARWADGQPVTAQDVVASWNFMMDEGLQAPMARIRWSKFEEPVAESKYLVRVKSSKVNWRNFLYFSGMIILPAHVLKDVDGETYVLDYNFKLLPGTGPYEVLEQDINKGNSLIIRKRKDYWAEKDRINVGLNNFDQIKEIVVRDRNLEFEMFKKGDLDYYFVNRAQMWVEDLEFDRIQRGLIQKRKIFNHSPLGIQGLAFNMRRIPFDDIRIRKALFHLFNREQLVEKLMYNEYELQHSYYSGGIYENPNNPKISYDPELALKILAEAGWRNRDERGRLVKQGQPLELELLYRSQTSERILTVYQEDLRKVGISLNLRLVTPETGFKLVMERQFDMFSMAWTASSFPDPETSWHSSLADVDNTNNITGVKSSRLDEITDAYDRMFELEERIGAIQEVDGILANLYPYMLEWTAPYHRIVFWNKFGYPSGHLTRTGDQRGIPTLWWIDPEKSQRLNSAQADPSIQLEVGQTEDRYWLDFDKVEEQAEPTAGL